MEIQKRKMLLATVRNGALYHRTNTKDTYRAEDMVDNDSSSCDQQAFIGSEL